MIRALLPGSYDPITVGHMDIIERASKLFGEVVVCVFDNSEKRYMFTPAERLDMIRASVARFPNARADLSRELVAEYAVRNEIGVLVKGIRGVVDYDYENMIASVNRSVNAGLETVFLPARAEYSHICSTAAREMIKYGRDLSGWLPNAAVEYINSIRQLHS